MPISKDTNQTKKPIKKSRQSTEVKKQSRGSDTALPKEKVTGKRMRDETRHTVYAVLSFILAAFFVMAGFKGAGPAGSGVYRAFSALFGVGYILAPLLCVLLGLSFAKSSRPNIGFTNTLGSILFLIGALGLVDVATNEAHRGGFIGKFGAMPFLSLFGVYGSILFLGGILIIGLVVLFDTKPNFLTLGPRLRTFFSKDKETIEEDTEEYEEEEEDDEPVAAQKKEEPAVTPILSKKVDEEEEFKPTKAFKHTSSYVPPPISLLAGDRGKPQVGDVKANLNIIRRTLLNFGIEVEMDEVTIGPTVTRYALKPAEGVKLSRIVALQSDLALALAAHPIRIEAPIPGKSLVGIEIPNKSKSIVGLASLLSEEKFTHAEKPLTVALGRNVAGKGIYANFAKMPHVLIAGATGSGKSVTIHAVVSSLLYRNGPEALRFIMIDPKRVELTLYNRIPHLLTPVITDPKKAILALKWAAKEMERRYDLLERNQVRDIESYHNNILAKGKTLKEGEEQERMPYIVIIIDELADIMQSYPRELEAAIVRLAQMSRAVGIHLLLSTQRPSVNVITGLIKANVPARVALQVASQIDSRTILDAAGAEKLLGAGDMLYSAGDMGSPERLQSAFISEDEVKKMVAFIAEHNGEVIEGEIALTGNNLSKESGIFDATIGDEADDDMYEEARETVIQAGKASTSFLQRKLGVGYARAARLIDMLEERGVVGPGSGAKPRDVLEKAPDSFRDDSGNNAINSL